MSTTADDDDTASMKFEQRGERLTMVAAGGLGTKEGLEHVETLPLEAVRMSFV